MLQLPLLSPEDARPQWERFPETRYLGSKRKLLGLLAQVFNRLEFDSALDPFSGTGAVAYLLKSLGKRVTASDAMVANATVARALVANHRVKLGGEVDALVDGLPDPGEEAGFIECTFDNLFFEKSENRFIDQYSSRVQRMTGPKRDLALFALFQSCLAKRPYNLFHRANLYMRQQEVSRSFGNKTTWERPFEELIRRYAAQADRAVFDSGQECRALSDEVATLAPDGYDLVYLDPPYVSASGAGVDYLDYYHFLEGLTDPHCWGDRILHRYKHKPLQGRGESPWQDPGRIASAFQAVLERFNRSIIVISYRSDGIPSADELLSLLKRVKGKVELIDAGQYVYALSRNRRSRELIFVGT